MYRRRGWPVVLLLGLLVGCDDGGGGPADARSSDTGITDARVADRGGPDARVVDQGGPPDAGSPDGAPPDGAMPDAGPPPDALAPDAGPPPVIGGTPAVVSGGARRATGRFRLTLTVGGPAPMAAPASDRFRLHLGVAAPHAAPQE